VLLANRTFTANCQLQTVRGTQFLKKTLAFLASRVVRICTTAGYFRRNYAQALDGLFALSAGRPLTRALFMEYRPEPRRRRWRGPPSRSASRPSES